MFIDRWIDKEAVGRTYNGILLSRKKECIWVNSDEVDEPKPIMQSILWALLYFLVLQVALGLPCIFPAPAPDSAVSAESPVSFYCSMVFGNQDWVLGVFAATWGHVTLKVNVYIIV